MHIKLKTILKLIHAHKYKAIKFKFSIHWSWAADQVSSAPVVLARNVRLWVRKFEICQARKQDRSTETTTRRRLHSSRPWQVVAVELVGPMPTFERSNNLILVLTDHFVRWTDALDIPDASAPTLAKISDHNVFWYFGLPEQMHIDQGTQFQSQLMSDFCKTWRVNQSWTTPYHPQGNGAVERNNRRLDDSEKPATG